MRRQISASTRRRSCANWVMARRRSPTCAPAASCDAIALSSSPRKRESRGCGSSVRALPLGPRLRGDDGGGRRVFVENSFQTRSTMLDQVLTSKMIARKDGAIGHLIFNNPARRNAVSLEMWEGVQHILDDFEKDDAVRVIVVSGAGGRAFVSGADISEFAEKRASA